MAHALSVRVEWPTLGLTCVVYVLFITATTVLPLWLAIPLLALVIAQHSSLQHEVLHGHPFRNQILSEATIFLPIGLFVPYLRFKDTHLRHHFDPNLTDPYDDPETNFFDPVHVAQMPEWMKRILRLNNLLFFRMFIGPVWAMIVFYRDDLRMIAQGDKRVLFGWLHHFAGLALLGVWLAHMAMPLWAYALAAYLGLSILKIRTFLEHQAHEQHTARSVIIEDRGLLALLFLNNNFHAVHHAHPQVAWYDLPGLYRSRREEFLRRNQGYRYGSYGDVFARYLFRAKDDIAHPIWSSENRTSPPSYRPLK